MSNQIGIAELKSLGPKSSEILARVGITTLGDLKKVGAVSAYVMAKRANKNVSLNLLWALESALTGEPWQKVAKLHRASLLLALEECKKNS